MMLRRGATVGLAIRIGCVAKKSFDGLSRHGSSRKFTAFPGWEIYAEKPQLPCICVEEDGLGRSTPSTENEVSVPTHGHFNKILRISVQKRLQASKHERINTGRPPYNGIFGQGGRLIVTLDQLGT